MNEFIGGVIVGALVATLFWLAVLVEARRHHRKRHFCERRWTENDL